MKRYLPIMVMAFTLSVCFAVPPTVDRIRIKQDKYTAAVSNACSLAFAEIWDWQNPGKWAVGPPGYDPASTNAKAEFGAWVNTNWMTDTNDPAQTWIEYRVTDDQTGHNADQSWINDLSQALRDAGLENEDFEVTKQ